MSLPAPAPVASGPGGPRGGADLRLVPAALVGWAGAWWALARPPTSVAQALVAGLLLTLAGVLAIVRGPRRQPCRATVQLLLCSSALVATLLAAAVQVAGRAAGPFPGWVRAQAVADLVGQVAADPRQVEPGRWDRDQGARYTVRLDVEEVTARGRRLPVRTTVLVLGGRDWASARVGSRVAVTGRLAPGEAGRRAAALVLAQGSPRLLEHPGPWWRAAEHVRVGLRRAVEPRSPDAGGLLPSLVVGDTSGLTPQVESDLRRSGLTHLTAVSGANVAIVTGATLWAAVAVGLLRRARLAVAALALVFFVVLARPEPSVVRAAAMGAVMLAGLVSSRRSRGIPALAGSVLVLLVLDPWLARDVGFALSAAATGSLLLLAPPWADRLQRWLPRPAALALAAPAAAQAACAPLVVLLQPEVSTVAVLANLLAEPAVLPATVLGVLAALVALAGPVVAEYLAAAGCVATWWITRVAAWTASLPVAEVGWSQGAGGAVLLGVLTAGVVWATLRVSVESPERGPRRPADRAGPSGAARRRLAAAMVVLLLGVGWWAGARTGRGWGSDDWAVAFCDVGQGDALVVRSGVDRAVLVDAGPDPARMQRCLDDLGVRALDLVVLSHFHRDHVAGLAGALAGRSTGPVLVSALDLPRDNAAEVTRVLAGRPAGPASAVTSAVSGRTGAQGWSVLWSIPAPALPPMPVENPDDPDGTTVNEAGLVVVLQVREPAGRTLRLIALGDLEVDGQRRLAGQLREDAAGPGMGGAVPPGGAVDVVKVAHHGSARQDPTLYRLLAPRLALVGVGADNDYGHPAPSTLGMLEGNGARVVRTDRDGPVAVSTVSGGTVSGGTVSGGPAGVGGDLRLSRGRGQLPGMAGSLWSWFTS